MSPRAVIAVYRPKPGKEEALLGLIRTHVAKLRGWELVTDRDPFILRAADGTLIEVFEWASSEAIERAHKHEGVQAMWAAFEAACDYLPLARVPEAANIFAGYAFLDLA